GYQPFTTAEIVVKDLRWHEQTLGVPVQWVPVSSGVQAHSALADGTMDIALLGSSPAAAGVAKGIPLEVIWIHDIIGDNEALVVRENSGINKVEDLGGKIIAAPFGSTTHYHLVVALTLARVGPKQTTVINLEPRDILAAWEKNEIDAAFIWMPTLAKIIARGGKVVLSSRDLAEKGFPTCDLAVIRREFGEQYPDLVVQYLVNQDRAVKFSRANPKAAAASVARQLDLPPAEAEKQLEALIMLTAKEQNEGKYFGGWHWNFALYTVLKETADFLKQQNLIQFLPDREAFLKAVNAKFLVEAAE
ncbi:MAG: glycine betaine ABC transporter substrate-binding protein, partial [Thermodesulfobacteriota bacterium]